MEFVIITTVGISKVVGYFNAIEQHQNKADAMMAFIVVTIAVLMALLLGGIMLTEYLVKKDLARAAKGIRKLSAETPEDLYRELYNNRKR